MNIRQRHLRGVQRRRKGFFVTAVFTRFFIVIAVRFSAVFLVTVFCIGFVRVVGIMFNMIFLSMIVMFILLAMGCGRCHLFVLMRMFRLRFLGVACGCCRKSRDQNSYQCFVHTHRPVIHVLALLRALSRASGGPIAEALR